MSFAGAPICIAIGIRTSGGIGSFSAGSFAVFFLCGVLTPGSFFIKPLSFASSRATISKVSFNYNSFSASGGKLLFGRLLAPKRLR
jgi:hypothetical protein